MDPFYDPARSYEANYADGPFGAFARRPVRSEPVAPPSPATTFVGLPVRMPFGIPAGPLLNARFVAAAFAHGFDLCVYKTVRTGARASHPHPNVLAVHVDGDLTPDLQRRPLVGDSHFTAPLSITNSFGVPSRDPDQWQPDMAAAVAAAGDGQLLIGGFQATRGSRGSLVADAVRAAQLVAETGAPVLELNLSCPNEATSDLLCFDTLTVRRIVDAITDEIGGRPLILKLARFEDDDALRELILATADRVAGYSAINTLPAAIVDASGAPALPGAGREISGVCGASIRWAGLDMTRRLAGIRARQDLSYAIIGVGGVSTPDDVAAYRTAGADAVMSATGAMWNPHLAAQVRSAQIRSAQRS